MQVGIQNYQIPQFGWADAISPLCYYLPCFWEDFLWRDRCCNNSLSTITLINVLAFKSGSPASLHLACPTTLAIFGACVPFLLSHNSVILVCPPMWLAACVFFLYVIPVCPPMWLAACVFLLFFLLQKKWKAFMKTVNTQLLTNTHKPFTIVKLG